MRKQLLSLSIVLLFLLSVNGTSAVVTDLDVDPILVIGEEGTGNGQFNEPDAVFVSSDGLIYAGDTNNLRVQVFDGDGTYIRELIGFTGKDVDINAEPQGIGELSSGTIVVTEKSGNVLFFNPNDGSLIKIVDLNITSSKGVDTQGLVVDTTTDEIYISNQPEFLVYVLDSNGAYIANFSTGEYTTPENMIIDYDNNKIFVSTEGAGAKIRSFDLDTYALIDQFGAADASTNFEGLVIDPFGNIIAVDEGGSSNDPARIVVFDKTNYSAIYAWGADATGAEEGQFASPDGIAFDYVNNRVLVADQGNFRIQVFDYVNIMIDSGIYSDDTSPTVSDTADITITEGDAETVSWTIEEDKYGGEYEVLQDNTVVKNGITTEGTNTVEYSLSDLSPGSYLFKLWARDLSGNIAEDLVTVTVEAVADTTPTTDTTDTTDTPLPTFVIPLGLSAMVILRKKK